MIVWRSISRRPHETEAFDVSTRWAGIPGPPSFHRKRAPQLAGWPDMGPSLTKQSLLVACPVLPPANPASTSLHTHVGHESHANDPRSMTLATQQTFLRLVPCTSEAALRGSEGQASVSRYPTPARPETGACAP